MRNGGLVGPGLNIGLVDDPDFDRLASATEEKRLKADNIFSNTDTSMNYRHCNKKTNIKVLQKHSKNNVEFLIKIYRNILKH